jgi:hypothetical protein
LPLEFVDLQRRRPIETANALSARSAHQLGGAMTNVLFVKLSRQLLPGLTRNETAERAAAGAA